MMSLKHLVVCALVMGALMSGGRAWAEEDATAQLELRMARFEQILEAQITLLRRDQTADILKMQSRLEALEKSFANLAARLAGVPAAPGESGEGVAISGDVPRYDGDVLVRLSEIEATSRTLNGQYDDIRFGLNRLSQQLEQMKQDNEFRFQNLETEVRRAASSSPSVPSAPSAQPQIIGQIKRKAPVAQIGEPLPDGIELVGEGTPITPEPIAPLRAELSDPTALYERGLADLREGAYDTAEADFKKLLADFPAHKLAGNAQYWLGEVYYVQHRYKQAADAFLAGYTQYAESTKAPDSLLKLGMTMAALGETKLGCDAFGELTQRFPDAPTAIIKRTEIEKRRVGCGA